MLPCQRAPGPCRDAHLDGSPCRHEWESHVAPLEQIFDTLAFHAAEDEDDA